MKSYLRFEPNKIFGIITTPTTNAQYDYTGNIAFTGGLSNVNCWNLRQATLINALTYKESSYPYITGGEVSILQRCSSKPVLSVGYSDGFIRVYNYLNEALSATLKGHKSMVSSLCFDEDGSTLCSGGSDGDIVLWDMISFTALCRLRGHKDRITGLGFIFVSNDDNLLALNNPAALVSGTKYLVSSSKDTLLKVWNVDVQYCVQTIVGHRCEIWSLAIRNNFHTGGVLIVTGAADELLRGYILVKNVLSKSPDNENDVLQYIGCMERQNGSIDKCASIIINNNGNLLAAQSSGKIIEIFRIRDVAEVKKKYKRRLKRLSESKVPASDTVDIGFASNSTVESGDIASSSSTVILSDLMEPMHVIRTTVRVRSIDFDPSHTHAKSSEDRCLVGLINNSLEIYQIPYTAISITATNDSMIKQTPSKLSVIDVHGHKSDVRCLCISGDNSTIATCSSESIKVWSTKTYNCVSTSRVNGYCLTIAYAPGGRYILSGNKEGVIQIFDSASGESVFQCSPSHTVEQTTPAVASPIWSIQVRPDGKGFLTAGADQKVTFWDFNVTAQGLSATINRRLNLSHDILCVKYSPSKTQDRLLFAVGLLDSTVRIYYDDSLKFFLSLYGHKLPVMCLDISYDSTILVSGSADKTIKIWGLDFGDCHRSLLAHTDSVTCVRFQPSTHYFFSSGKDGVCKYWDADRFEQILLLPGHSGCLWGLDISSDASQLYTCGQDRSIRLWIRTDDLVFVEEERERALEAQVEKSAESDLLIDENPQEASTTIVGIATKNIESVKGGEMLMEAIDLVESELANYIDGHNNETKLKTQRYRNPLLLGLTPLLYMLRCLRMIKTPDLEQALLVLPFHYVTRIISMLIKLVKNGLDIELCTKCAICLLRCHQAQLLNTHSLLPEMLELRDLISTSINSYRSLVGMNIAGLKNMKRKWDTQQQDRLEIL